MTQIRLEHENEDADNLARYRRRLKEKSAEALYNALEEIAHKPHSMFDLRQIAIDAIDAVEVNALDKTEKP